MYKLYKTIVFLSLLLLLACTQSIKITIVDKDTGKPLQKAKIITYIDGKRKVIATSDVNGEVLLPISYLSGKTQVFKRKYKKYKLEMDKMKDKNSIKIKLQEKNPPKEVKNLRVEFEDNSSILKWSASTSPDVDYYTIQWKKNLNTFKTVKKIHRETSIKIEAMEKGIDYSFIVRATDKNRNKNKGSHLKIYMAEPKIGLKKNAAVSGKIIGVSKAEIHVILYSVNLGEFANYDVSPVQLKCNKDGEYKSDKIPAGKYSLLAYEDLNKNGFYDGNWLGAEPEPYLRQNSIILKANKNNLLPTFKLSAPQKGVPQPIFDENKGFVELYNAAWDFAREKRSVGSVKNGFRHAYMDEGFNDHIYQWDTCFMMFFGIYGGVDFPAMNSIDNFYLKQRENGYICRVQSETTGKDYDPSKHDPLINPPLYTWVEYNYYRISGDESRLLWAISFNHKYFNWIKNNCRTPEGYYFTSNLGSGMDNSPREGSAYGWIDITAQMGLFAYYMEKIAKAAGLLKIAGVYHNEYITLKKLINDKMWDKETGIYFDVKKNKKLHKKKTIGSFWPMLAKISSKNQTDKLVAHLKNPNEFATPHMFPTLAKDEKEYDEKGYYWRGAVWAPTEFMVIKGLEYNGEEEFARKATLNHLQNMLDVYQNFVPSKKKLPYKEGNIPFPADLDGTKQIWECYSSEKKEPSTRWDNFYYVRPKFVGWSGCGPITLFIENVIGIRLDAPKNRVVWKINSKQRHGIKQLAFSGGVIDLLMKEIKNGKPVIEVKSTVDFQLVIEYNGKKINKTVRRSNNPIIFK